MDDAAFRAQFDDAPVPEFETTAFTKPRPLPDATAGLLAPGEKAWLAPGGQSFRWLASSERDLQLGRLSRTFDRVGLSADLNVVYPADRLAEMAEEGMIGRVAPRHISFNGGGPRAELETIRLDIGAAAAKTLRDDGVDVVLLTPI